MAQKSISSLSVSNIRLFNFRKQPLIWQQQPTLSCLLLQLYPAVALPTSKGKQEWMTAATQKNNSKIFSLSPRQQAYQRQIPLTASPHALHLSVSCQSVFPTVRVICTWGSIRAPTFLIKMTGNLVYTGPGVPAARTLVRPREMQKFPAVAFRLPKISQLPTKEDEGC